MRRIVVLPLCGVAMAAQAQAPSLTQRVAAAEAVVATHYRGEPLDVARSKSNAAIDAYNVRTKTAQAELDAAKAAWERSQAPSRKQEAELRARIQALDEALKVIPDGNDQPGNARYQAKVQERKAVVKQVNDLIAQANAALEGYNVQVRSVQAALGAEREQVEAQLQAVNRRVDAFAAFAKGGGDVAFFSNLNGLLAEARMAGDAGALD